MSATWRANFGDAILLDPLILVHGNVKDVFPLDEEARSRMPAELRGQSAVTFDVWLALELEREGFDIVCLYDPITRITVLRRSMAGCTTDPGEQGGGVHAGCAAGIRC